MAGASKVLATAIPTKLASATHAIPANRKWRVSIFPPDSEARCRDTGSKCGTSGAGPEERVTWSKRALSHKSVYQLKHEFQRADRICCNFAQIAFTQGRTVDSPGSPSSQD